MNHELIETTPPAQSEDYDLDSRDARLRPGDRGTLSLHSRRALVLLVKGPYLSAQRHGEAWRALIVDAEAIRSRLADLMLDLVISEDYGVAFVRNAESETHDLPQVVRTMPLTFMDSLMLLHLRKELVRSGGNERAFIGRDELTDALLHYIPQGSTDRAGYLKRVNGSLNKCEKHNLLLSTDSPGRYEISPVLRLVFTPEQVAAVSAEYATHLNTQTDSDALLSTDDDNEQDEA